MGRSPIPSPSRRSEKAKKQVVWQSRGRNSVLACECRQTVGLRRYFDGTSNVSEKKNRLNGAAAVFKAVSQLLWPDKEREVWLSLRENREKANRFGLHQLRNSQAAVFGVGILPFHQAIRCSPIFLKSFAFRTMGQHPIAGNCGRWIALYGSELTRWSFGAQPTDIRNRGPVRPRGRSGEDGQTLRRSS
jgi:hypothetical protein